MRILMFGSRTWVNDDAISAELMRLYVRYGKALVIVHGDEPNGADRRISRACYHSHIRHEEYCAAPPRDYQRGNCKIVQASDWKRDGRRAGPLRNEAMLNSGVQGAVGFRMAGVSRGTDHMASLILAAGVPLIRRGVWNEAKEPNE